MHRSSAALVARFARVAALVAAAVCPSAGVAGELITEGPRIGGLWAGASAVDVTPPLGMPIVGNWTSPPAERVHDPIMARALVLQNGDDRLALVLCDNVGIPREVFDAARALVAEQTGIAPAQALMASTHTHSSVSARNDATKVGGSPTLNGDKPSLAEGNEYQRALADGIAAAVRQAVDQLEPAEIAWGRVAVPEHLNNRRWYVSDPDLLRNPFGGVDKVKMNPPRGSGALEKPAGPTDPEVSFLSVRSRGAGDEQPRPIALLANYSLHYVGGVPGGDLSADYFGVFAQRIAARLDAERLTPRFVGILSNGTSGDVNNVNFTSRTPTGDGPYVAMERVADDLAAKVAAAHEGLEFHTDVPLASAGRDVMLKVRKPTPEQLAHFDAVEARAERGEKPEHSLELNYARRGRSLAEQPDEVAIPLQAHRIGPIGIAAIPFETFTETGLELKREVPELPGFERAFTIELANGSYGYLPTPEQHELGGYETWLGTSAVQKDATRLIVRNLLELFAELSPAVSGPQ
ncbi:hypothetical protein [Alienimonas californiensis]|uniref:Neutral/alkaline non-lysosomal ceramidase n=1 Tax=Alienimonas californiensis TaxID=2527989 RepID=A0A517P8G9_9PLAN|nr:hypothetical protein [Alienimonas californiensis]QDT15664.1 Neutral/alkaline non-lysosomal ceramidase [Alienimonas californiensis]